MGTKDITDYWKTFLDELYDLETTLKVPGRKVKSKSKKTEFHHRKYRLRAAICEDYVP
jgi:hypothetical protein